jgi:hypothetical protein
MSDDCNRGTTSGDEEVKEGVEYEEKEENPSRG